MMTAIRAFIALEISQPHKQKISGLISSLKSSDADIRWLAENQMHLTLKFLGNIQQDSVKNISQILRSIAMDTNAFTMDLTGIGAFPNIKHPKVIWLGIEKGSLSINILSDKIEQGLEHLGFKREKRLFKPHLTLGRVKSLKNIKKLLDIIAKIKFQCEEFILINKIILFQSTLTPKGAVYSILEEYPFNK